MAKAPPVHAPDLCLNYRQMNTKKSWWWPATCKENGDGGSQKERERGEERVIDRNQ